MRAKSMSDFPYPTYLLGSLGFGPLFVFLLTLVGLFHPIRKKSRLTEPSIPIISDDRGVESHDHIQIGLKERERDTDMM